MMDLDKTKWKTFAFDQIASSIGQRVEPGATDLDIYVGLEHIDPENIHIKRFGKPSDVEGTKLRAYPGDVIFGKRRAYQRKAAIAEFDCICSAHAMVLRANPDVIHPRLFPFFLHSDAFMNKAIEISVGSLSPTINWGTLRHQQFLLPPKDQQARLAELLWAGDEAVEKDNDLITKIETLKAVVSRNYLDLNMLSGKESSKWQQLTMKDIGEIGSGATPSRAEKEKYYDNGNIPWLKTLDLNNGFITNTEENITSVGLKESSCKVRPINTVLVAMYGGFNQIGRTGLLKIEAATNQAVCAIIPDSKRILSEYLLNLLNTNVDYWKRVASSSRKDPNITKSDVEKFPVPLPPIQIQQEIVEIIRALNSTLASSRDKKSNSKALVKSLLSQIFHP